MVRPWAICAFHSNVLFSLVRMFCAGRAGASPIFHLFVFLTVLGLAAASLRERLFPTYFGGVRTEVLALECLASIGAFSVKSLRKRTIQTMATWQLIVNRPRLSQSVACTTCSSSEDIRFSLMTGRGTKFRIDIVRASHVVKQQATMHKP